VHVVPGYTVGGLLAFRLLWGVIGTRYARFSSLVFPPGAVLAYLRSLAGRAPQHFVGHNPAGALAIFAMLGLLAAATLTGWAGWVELGGEWLEDVHEALAQAALLFVGIHLAGVAVSSWLHRATGAERSCSGRRAARWRRSRDPARAGFADRAAGGVAWRVYSLAMRDREVQIDVAQRVVDRRATARGGALRLLVPAVALALLLAGGSWLIVRRVTAPLVAFSGAIDALAPGRGAPVATSDLPSEMMPVGEAVNRLLARADEALRHERTLTGDAAHELRTPLAAMRAQGAGSPSFSTRSRDWR
jgi:cytochrome b